jgi:hypothetical protein
MCDMYMSSLRHIHDPVLSSLKMKGIRFFFMQYYNTCPATAFCISFLFRFVPIIWYNKQVTWDTEVNWVFTRKSSVMYKAAKCIIRLNFKRLDIVTWSPSWLTTRKPQSKTFITVRPLLPTHCSCRWLFVVPDRTHGHTPHSVGLPLIMDRSFIEISVCTNHNTHKRQNTWSRRDSNPESHQASGRRPTHTATLVTGPTQQSKPIFVWTYISTHVWLPVIRQACPDFYRQKDFFLSVMWTLHDARVWWCLGRIFADG